MQHPVPIARYHASLIFLVGMACMIVAGFFLIEGLSQFAGSSTTRNILIVGGILFQVTESLCFIAAAALSFHSLVWRITLFGLGCVLFLFSIGVMTLAQKTALQSGINEANAIDEKRDHIREQLASLDRMIDSYQFNAEKQSRSIYKDSRALGQDSINRASELEREKLRLSDELFNLNQTRRETSADFFSRLQDVTGLPAKESEFYFLVIRSLLLELSGILLMAFGANLRAITPPANKPIPIINALKWHSSPISQQQELALRESDPAPNRQVQAQEPSVAPAQAAAPVEATSVQEPAPAAYTDEAPDPDPNPAVQDNPEPDSPTQDYLNAPIEVYEDDDKVVSFKEHSFSKYIEGMKRNQKQIQVEQEIQELGDLVTELFQTGKLKTFGRDPIIRALREHFSIKVGSVKAKKIQAYCEALQQQSDLEK